ncbi:hypothetical protein [Haliangium sp.]|uniref:hypothetical protein n=1 Tax=Haliangium sp. TaxID=2663208 RepID=UPI003D14EFCB
MSVLRSHLLLLASALMLIGFALGCGTTNAQGKPTAKLAKGEKVRCERYVPTGSHLPRSRCVTESDVKARRGNDQEKVRAFQLNSAIDTSPSD